MRFVAVLALTACSSGPRFVRGPEGEPQPIVEPLAPPITFGPITQPAAAFNEEAEPGSANAVLDDVHAAIAELAHVRGIVRSDPRLDAVAAEVAESVRHGAPATDGLVDFALHEHGIVEAAGLALVAHGTTAEAITADLAAHLGNALFFGNVYLGIGGIEPTVAVVTYGSAITITGAPRHLDADGSAELHIQLDLTFHGIHVTVHHEDGTISSLVTTVDGVGYASHFECGAHEGPQWLQVEATADVHTTARTLVPIYCATKPPATYATEPVANLPSTDPQRRLIALINRERAALGIPLLAIDPRASWAARDTAQRMASTSSIEHTLGGTTPETRLRHAGLLPPLALETTMHAESIAHAAELLLNVPKYRADVVDPRVTRIGLARISGDDARGFYMAIEYVRVVPPTDVAPIKTAIYNMLRQRSERVTETAALDAAAAWYAKHLAAGWSDKTLRDVFFRVFTLEGLHVKNIAAATFSTEDPSWLHAIIATRLAPSVGIAVLQSARDGAFAGRVFIVFVTGDPTTH